LIGEGAYGRVRKSYREATVDEKEEKGKENLS